MKNITIKAPSNFDCDMSQWTAKYTAQAHPGALLVRIEARSSIDVVVTKIDEEGLLGIQTSYYISSPNFGVAIPGISSLQEDFWITEQLLNHNMPTPDAVTIVQVLRELGDF